MAIRDIRNLALQNHLNRYETERKESAEFQKDTQPGFTQQDAWYGNKKKIPWPFKLLFLLILGFMVRACAAPL